MTELKTRTPPSLTCQHTRSKQPTGTTSTTSKISPPTLHETPLSPTLYSRIHQALTPTTYNPVRLWHGTPTYKHSKPKKPLSPRQKSSKPSTPRDRIPKFRHVPGSSGFQEIRITGSHGSTSQVSNPQHHRVSTKPPINT